jgi:hypothetical protein
LPTVTAPIESAALHARVRAVVAAYVRREPMPEGYDAIAVDVARFQARYVPGYARLCAARGVDGSTLRNSHEAPAVPTDAFKLATVFAFDPSEAAATFRTSGTTIGARGTHRLRDVATYDAGAIAFGHDSLAAGLALPTPVLVLGPSPDEAPDSSLAHMNGRFVGAWARAGANGGATADAEAGPRADDAPRTWFVRGGELDVEGLRARIAGLDPSRPAIVLATSFALVHLLDAFSGTRTRAEAHPRLELPRGSRVMQTGGYKGRSREVDAAELRAAVARLFDVAQRDIVSEYGMTELSSQFWEATAVDPAARPGVYREPPWARVVPVDPETLRPVPPGEVGIARIEDLANVDSAFAVLAQDRVRRVVRSAAHAHLADEGFELLGRAPGAPPRGCSIAIDEMLGGGGAGA